MTVRAGNLREQLIILKRTTKESNDGRLKDKWKEVCQVWGQIRTSEKGRHTLVVRQGIPAFQYFKWREKYWCVTKRIPHLTGALGDKVGFQEMEKSS